MKTVGAVALIGVLTVLGALPVIGQVIELDPHDLRPLPDVWRDAATHVGLSEYVPSEGRSL